MIDQISEYVRTNKIYLVALLIIIVIATISTIKELGIRKKILKSGVFVVGKIVRIRKTRGTSIEYEYNFLGQRFQSSEGLHVDSEYVGARYLVKIDPASPSESRLLKDCFVPDSLIVKQPDSGWIRKPFSVH